MDNNTLSQLEAVSRRSNLVLIDEPHQNDGRDWLPSALREIMRRWPRLTRKAWLKMNRRRSS